MRSAQARFWAATEHQLALHQGAFGRDCRGTLAAMSAVRIVASTTEVPLTPAPIERSWIRSGNPQARNTVLSCSVDGTAMTIIWDCTAGEFEWHYDVDETVYFLEGEVTICDRHSAPKTFKAGDVLYLPRGAICDWHVKRYVRKLAIWRRPQPWVFCFLLRAAGRIKRTLRGALPSFGADGLSPFHPDNVQRRDAPMHRHRANQND
jgi:uncharacterized cupin superfamily protein